MTTPLDHLTALQLTHTRMQALDARLVAALNPVEASPIIAEMYALLAEVWQITRLTDLDKSDKHGLWTLANALRREHDAVWLSLNRYAKSEYPTRNTAASGRIKEKYWEAFYRRVWSAYEHASAALFDGCGLTFADLY